MHSLCTFYAYIWMFPSFHHHLHWEQNERMYFAVICAVQVRDCIRLLQCKLDIGFILKCVLVRLMRNHMKIKLCNYMIYNIHSRYFQSSQQCSLNSNSLVAHFEVVSCNNNVNYNIQHCISRIDSKVKAIESFVENIFQLAIIECIYLTFECHQGSLGLWNRDSIKLYRAIWVRRTNKL